MSFPNDDPKTPWGPQLEAARERIASEPGPEGLYTEEMVEALINAAGLDQENMRLIVTSLRRDMALNTQSAVRSAVMVEREECAQIADAIDSNRGNEKEIAAAIRARGKVKP